ncbi:MAG: HAMP domain-containing protein [Deltaproteobacteria bacterium]|nr:HAMP domain-containing protein [Deltaproteobacteria bacterium]
MGLKLRLLLFSMIAIVVPVLLIIISSTVLIYKNNLITHWKSLDRIIEFTIKDFKDTERNHSVHSLSLSQDDYIKTKLHFYVKYREFLRSTTIEWDLVQLKSYISNYSLENNVETIAIYELIENQFNEKQFNRVLCVGNYSFVPLSFSSNASQKRFNNSYYTHLLDIVYSNSLKPVYVNDQIVGLILFQRAFDSSYFYNFALKNDIDLAVTINDKVIFCSFSDDRKKALKDIIAKSTKKHGYFRLKDKLFHTSFLSLTLGNDLRGSLIAISKGDSFFQSGGLYVVNLASIGIISIIISVLLLYLWGRRLIKSINHLYNGTSEVSRGNLNYKITLDRNDELGTLAVNFNDMISTIKSDKENLEEKNAELCLINHYIDAVFQSLQVDTVVIDRSFNIVLANHNAKNTLNFPSDFKLKNIFNIQFFKSQEDNFLRTIKDVFHYGEDRNIEEIKIDDSFYTIDFFPIKENGNDIFGIVIVIINVTDSKLLNQELLKSQKVAAIGQLSASLAHEINNPIGIILNHVQLLKSKKLKKEEEAAFLNRIESEILRIINLIENLLQFSRNEIKDTVKIDLWAIIVQILELLKPLLEKKHIKLKLSEKAIKTTIYGNVNLLKQLFFNLIKNSIESIEHTHGIIQVSIDNENDRIRITICDNGKGIDSAITDKIFDPFFTSKSHPNVGLGLPFCKEIIKKHKGNIVMSSEEKKDTMVTLYFPSEMRT